jgi:hypothetical protein
MEPYIERTILQIIPAQENAVAVFKNPDGTENNSKVICWALVKLKILSETGQDTSVEMDGVHNTDCGLEVIGDCVNFERFDFISEK